MKRAIIIQLLILIIIGTAGCQAPSLPAPTSTPRPVQTTPTAQTIEVTRATVAGDPNPTPAVCTPLAEGMEINVEPTSADSVLVQLHGFQPRESLAFSFVARPTATQGSTLEYFPSDTVSPDGTYTHQQGGLTPLSDDGENVWEVKVIHTHGVACQEITLPPATATVPPPTPPPPVFLPGTLEWVSMAADGTPGNSTSGTPSLSADGRFVAFISRAGNLVADDSDTDCTDIRADPPQYSCSDVFVLDRQSGVIERVSVASDGTPGNNDSGELTSISADGRFVVFESYAGNLAPGCLGLYLHDRQSGETTCAVVTGDGTPADGPSAWPVISANGRLVAFYSEASNLVPNDTNGIADVFVYDRETGRIERVSVASDGTEANEGLLLHYIPTVIPALSTDGRFVAFNFYADNLVPGDTNDTWDIFVHDRQTGTTERVSIAGDGTEGNGPSHYPTLSADGRFVAFQSEANNLVPDDTNRMTDIFVHDRQTGETTRVNVASDGTQAYQDDSGWPVISANGRWVAFISGSPTLVPNDTNGHSDIFVHDRQTGQTVRVSIAHDGTQANGSSGGMAFSGDGRFLAFTSFASNLLPGDTNERGDIFIRDLQPIWEED